MDSITYTGRTWAHDLPIKTTTGVRKKKTTYINLNLYRNAVGMVINNQKKAFKALIIEDFKKTFADDTFERCVLEYRLFLPDKRGRDVANVCSIIDKFYSDVLVTEGKIEDDNYKFIPKVTYMLGGTDETGEGYVTVTVREID